MAYKQAKGQLRGHLESLGWTMRSPTPKIPHATAPDDGNRYSDSVRVWFKPQALYVGFTGSLGDARSVHLDIRETSIDRIMYAVNTF